MTTRRRRFYDLGAPYAKCGIDLHALRQAALQFGGERLVYVGSLHDNGDVGIQIEAGFWNISVYLDAADAAAIIFADWLAKGAPRAPWTVRRAIAGAAA